MCRQASWYEETVSFSHFRDKDGVEVKAAATVTGDDFKGLRKLQDATQKNFAAGVVLYDGAAVVPLGKIYMPFPYPDFGITEDNAKRGTD